ncbi:MAG TPA: fumarylacetoacetate hydrolase family protein [Allosphingosinicella sp.]|nr:fumarylacetoacetate hydrolase family protein [Allosphingosinicella sp.]
MRLCWFDDRRFGLVRGDHVLDVTAALEGMLPDDYPARGGDPVLGRLETLIPRIESAASTAAARPVGDVRFLSPVGRPTKIVGTPANYLKHVAEAEADIATFTNRYSGPIREQGLFLKSVSALIGPSEGVTLRFPDRQTHHEMELGVVIGRKASQVSEAEAMDHVAGYAIALDMVVRGPEDRSFRKSIDTYAVLGPWLVTKDEIADPQALDFSLSVNGEQRQASNTGLMILSIAEQIAWASQFYTLWPGDIIMTGTCEGVGRVFPGDVMHCAIDQVGAMDVAVA